MPGPRIATVRITTDCQVWPVVAATDAGTVHGGVLVHTSRPELIHGDPFEEDPIGALDWSVASLRQALDLLERLPEPQWLAVPLPALALTAGRSLLRRLSQAGDADLAARLDRVGRRLVLLLPQGHRALDWDPALLAGLAERHGLAELWHRLGPSSFQDAPGLRLERVILAPDLVAGIDADPRHQRQWAFAHQGLSALQIELIPAGVSCASELAWLRRHGCREICGPPWVASEPVETFGLRPPRIQPVAVV